MQPIRRNSAYVFASLAFGEVDPLRVPEPQAKRSICHAWNEVLRAPEGEGGGGGGDQAKTFTQEQVDKIVGERVGKMKSEIEGFKAQIAKLGDLEKKLADADAREQAAREEAELKGKSDLEKLSIQLQKSTDKLKALESDRAKDRSDFESQLKSERDAHLGYRKQTQVQSALSAVGLAKGADRFAVQAFISEAQLELDDSHAIKSIAVGGKTFSKLDEAAKHFVSENPIFAAPQQGGSGHPKGFGPFSGVENAHSVDGLLSAGLQQHTEQ